MRRSCSMSSLIWEIQRRVRVIYTECCKTWLPQGVSYIRREIVLDKVYRTPRKNMHLGDMSRERHVLGKPRVISLA